MGFKLINRVHDTGLPPTDRLVLLILADSAGDDQARCWRSVASICERTGLSDRAVQQSTKRLEAGGHISREDRRGRSSIYTIHPRPKAGSAPEAASEVAASQETSAISPQLSILDEGIQAPKELLPTSEGGSEAPEPASPKPPISLSESPTNQPSHDSGSFEEMLERCYKLAGWRPQTDAHRCRARNELVGWLDEGFDFLEDVVPGIEDLLHEKVGDTHSLQRFTKRIRSLHRKRTFEAERLAALKQRRAARELPTGHAPPEISEEEKRVVAKQLASLLRDMTPTPSDRR